MSDFNDIKSLLDAAFAALTSKGINVTGWQRSQLAAAIGDIEPNDHAQINQLLSSILGEPVTDTMTGLAKLADIKEEERQAIVAKGTLVTPADRYDLYAQKIRAIRSYSDLTFSGLMPAFILDPEPTGSTVVYMRPGTTGDGSSWDNATGDFVTAHASLSGTQNVIYMEEGVYPATGTISLKANTKIYGGFKASDHSWSSRNGFIYRTVLDAQLTHFQLVGNSTCVLCSLTIINARNTAASPFYALNACKNLIAQDCTNTASGGGVSVSSNCSNLIAINCQAGSGGGFYSLTNCNNLIAINCKSTSNGGGGVNASTGCNNLLMLNCNAVNAGGGGYSLMNCTNAKIINCSSTAGAGGATYSDNNCKNFLVVNCSALGGSVIWNPINCQNYTVVNCITSSYAVAIAGSVTFATNCRIYNFVCLNNKTTSGTLIGLYLNTANVYYKLYHCRADAAISFAANAATNADIQNFALVQNDNSDTKFINKGTYPVAGNLPYENSVINQKYLDGNYGNFNIPADSVLAGAGYWEDGFSFGWDIDGKPRNANHCSIGAYEPVWA